MNPEHLNLLRSPKTNKELSCEKAQIVGGRIKSGVLTDHCGNSYPIVDFIPRFVASDTYCLSFSLEWNQHPEILFGSFSNLFAYRERFTRETKWGRNLRGQLVLEAGCGCGAFTQYALETGALVVSFDASKGVEQNYRLNGQRENILIIQASIYEMPLPNYSFDKVFCFGVLQHTPNPKDAFLQLVLKLKPGGHIASDIYALTPKKSPLTGLLKTKYFLRRFTAGRNPQKLHKWISKYVKTVWPLRSIIQKIPTVGIAFNRRLLLDNYLERLMGMHEHMYQEFAILDIYDMLATTHDFPQSLDEFKRWHHLAKLENIDVHYGYNGIEGRGSVPILHNFQ